MATNKSGVKEIFIEFVGGPLDGAVRGMEKPFTARVEVESHFRSDIKYDYRFDESEKNKNIPLKFKFFGYIHL